jgi:hypothetical protein
VIIEPGRISAIPAGVQVADSGRQAFLLIGSDHRRCHKGWRYRVDNAALEDGIDLRLGRRIDMPAFDITDGVELAGIPGTPEGDRWALIKHPAHRKCQYRFAKALSRQLFEFIDRREILRVAVALEFRIDITEIIAVECGLHGHPPAEETTTQRAVTQDRQSSANGIGQHVSLDVALKEVVGRLHSVELGVSTKHPHLGG